jgi:predicted Zn-dependent peptidase
MGQMTNYALYGEDDDAIYVDTIKGITAADIQEVARQIFRSGNLFEVGMTSPMEDVEQAKNNE